MCFPSMTTSSTSRERKPAMPGIKKGWGPSRKHIRSLISDKSTLAVELGSGFSLDNYLQNGSIHVYSSMTCFIHFDHEPWLKEHLYRIQFYSSKG